MFIVSKALLISCATVIVRAGGAIWVNPFVTVIFNVCNAVTVECCVLYTCLVCLLLRKEECSSPVSAITERMYMGLIYVFVGLWDGEYVIQLPYVWNYVVVTSSFKHAREK